MTTTTNEAAMAAYNLRNKILGLLETIKDKGSYIDAGHYLVAGISECWVTVGGIEYHVSIKEAVQ